MWTLVFWIGFLVLLAHAVVLGIGGARGTAVVALAGTAAMFVGSKIGREFLGIATA